MNEPSSFVDGSTNGCPQTTFDNPPYTPKVLGNQLSSKTICASARQHVSSHYNLHNMYGHFEAIATYSALQAIMPNKRSFVLSRSSYAGTGKFAAHWSGDNRANWDDLYYSIPNMLNFNMFGVSQVGSDICGFQGDTTEELCIRWMQLGSFYPFMRNHNDDSSKDQDPAVFSLEAQEAIRKTLLTRYTLLPYLYTLFYRSSVMGDTVVRPLFFEFTRDTQTHFTDRQFMFGPAFLITPVLEQGATTVRGYFPTQETWYKLDTGAAVDNKNNDGYVELETPLSDINVHLRAGYIVPTQFPGLTTTKSRMNPFELLVALKKVNSTSGLRGEDSFAASGNLFWDDGESAGNLPFSKLKIDSFGLFF
jgi:alpha-glucosidase (family GH31 glycosyl hydrolase)